MLTSWPGFSPSPQLCPVIPWPCLTPILLTGSDQDPSRPMSWTGPSLPCPYGGAWCPGLGLPLFASSLPCSLAGTDCDSLASRYHGDAWAVILLSLFLFFFFIPWICLCTGWPAIFERYEIFMKPPLLVTQIKDCGSALWLDQGLRYNAVTSVVDPTIKD